MRALIVDDEPMPARHLEEMVKKHAFEIKQVDLCFEPEKALELIDQIDYDILFLDVEMPKMDAFEFLEKVNLSPQTVIIFTTAYSQYAVEAFKANAVHYILKPVTEDELIKSIRKAVSQIRAHEIGNNKPSFRNISISIYDGEEYEIIRSENIIRLEADGSYTTIITKEKELLSTKRIGYYEQKLKEAGFCRCHNSHLINLSFLERIGKGKGSYLVLSNQEVVPLSTSRKAELEAKLGL